ncbi:efflux RND transporter permease subunit [Desulfosporosinus sp.]|uniref:efflux RND transporter permease subunit n=1 Tax=Desulfosporosinus sp. TaxID=157907 RepID=UPI0025C1EB40|nr:efflux RND transporter permease subunit [Desulfosporosinus sp.]MBC2723922.1 efflux RND transporter permease subunit [Desulfosporosinus sp.]MBC2727130.1 efflux RND transporter permease subunit [Desulfosporosinus sp.]
MDKGIIYQVIHNRRFTLFFTFIALLLGIYSFYVIPKQESPKVNAPFAIIQTIYPGAEPADVEKLVTKVIEDKTIEVPGYKTSSSYSRNSVSIVVLELQNDADVDKAWLDLRRYMDDLQSTLPSECQKIEVQTDLADTPGMILSLSGDQYSYEQLSDFADQYKNELSKIKGITRFEVDGVQTKEAQVEVNTSRFNQLALSLEDIVNALKIQNVNIPSGSLSDGTSKINVSISGSFNSLQDIENCVVSISKATGAIVYLKDIAKVSWGLADSTTRIRENGNNAILLSAFFSENDNIVMIGHEVQTILHQLKQQLPPGLIVDEVTYQPANVDKSVTNFFENLLEGIALVLAVVFLGMGLKNAIVASTAVPLSILIAFSAMYLLEIKVHEISIAALIISLGILVDDAIVIIDSIQVLIDEGMEKMSACVNGTKRAVLPVFTATLTTGAAFAPMLFVPGPAGEFLHSLPEVVILAVAASFIVAIFVTPVLAYIFFDQLKQRKTYKRSPVKNFYQGFLAISMKYKKLTLLIALSIFGLTALLALKLPVMFFPKADVNMFYINIHAETSADLDNTDRVAQQVEKLVSAQKEVLDYTTSVGEGLPKFYLTVEQSTQSQDFAQVLLKVDLAKGGRFKSNEEMAVYMQEHLNERLIGGTARVELLEKAFPGTPIGIQINSNDQQALTKAVNYIHDQLIAIPGTLNVEDDLDSSEYQFKVNIDHDKASQSGITKYDIERQINIALKGAEATVLRKAGNEYPILVTSDIQSKEALENLVIKSSLSDQKVLLKQIATFSLEASIPTIRKYDRELAITVSSQVKPGYSAVTIENNLKQILAQNPEVLKGVSLSYKGEAKNISDNFGDLGTAALFALLAIYVILMLQFRSFLQPFIIFITIPLSLFGVIIGLFAFGQPLSFTALVGVVSLMGIVIKNAILLIEYINIARKEGMSVTEACFDAVSKRYRPIFLSAMTTVIGLVPLALSGSDLFEPLSVAIMCGLIASTLLTLVIIPVVYSIWFEKREVSITTGNATI